MRHGKMDGIRTWLSILACVLIVTMSIGTPAYAQEEEAQPTQDPAQLMPNDPTAPQDDESDDEGAAPSTPEPTGSQDDDSETVATQEPQQQQQAGTNTQPRLAERAEDAAGPGAPAVLAHGLAYVSGDDVAWQVREMDIPDIDQARQESTEEAIILQRDGTSIVRNDVTGKRALLHPGEAFFRAADDPYTVMSEDSESIAWMFELVDPDDVALDAFYESPVIGDLDEGVFDMRLVRYVLQPGESADMPTHSGAGVLMVTSGEVTVDMGGDLGVLEPGDGQSVQGDTLTTNDGTRAAVFAYVYLGDEVSDASAGAPQGPQTATSVSETESETDGTDGTTSTDTGTTDTLDEAADTTTDTQTAVPPVSESGANLTSINVTAEAEIYLTITVDGLTVFDGTLPAGASSGPVTGNTFEVYTSSGINTTFTNACGDTFKMGYEEGEAWYTLSASAESCPP